MFVWFLKCLFFHRVADNICSHHALVLWASKTYNYNREQQDKACWNILADPFSCKHKILKCYFLLYPAQLSFSSPRNTTSHHFLLRAFKFAEIPLLAPQQKREGRIPYSGKQWQSPRLGRDWAVCALESKFHFPACWGIHCLSSTQERSLSPPPGTHGSLGDLLIVKQKLWKPYLASFLHGAVPQHRAWQDCCWKVPSEKEIMCVYFGWKSISVHSSITLCKAPVITLSKLEI